MQTQRGQGVPGYRAQRRPNLFERILEGAVRVMLEPGDRQLGDWIAWTLLAVVYVYLGLLVVQAVERL